MSKYLVICEKNGDEFITVHDTPEAATARAESDWGYLTDSEKRRQRIYTLCVSRDQLSGWAVDEDSGDIDWTYYESGSTYPGCFDSAVYEEQKYLKEIAEFIADEGDEDAWQRSDEDNGLFIFNGTVEYDRSLWACKVTCRGSISKYSIEYYNIRRA